MRNEFLDALLALAGHDDRVVLLTGDLGFTVLEPFAERFPERFFNVGVAEQNMIGLATGLAEAGYVPFAYSIATFASMRPYEFIRNGPVLHQLPVRIVGVGGGLDYGHNGATHYALEDIGILRVQSGLTIVVPADARQAVDALADSSGLPGPIYFRLAKQGAPVPGLERRFRLGRLDVIGQARDLAFVACGPSAGDAVEAMRRLRERGVEAAVGIVSSFNPAAEDDLAELLADVPFVVTVESHYRVGGVGSLVAEVIAERGLRCRLVRCGLDAIPRGLTGTTDYLDEHYGLSAPRLVDVAVGTLELAR